MGKGKHSYYGDVSLDCSFLCCNAYIYLPWCYEFDTCLYSRRSDARESDKTYKLDVKRSCFRNVCKDLMLMWQSLDLNGDGLLSREEMQTGFHDNAAFAKAIHSLDMRKHDIDMLFEMMDRDNSGLVDYQEFVICLYQIEYQSSKTLLTFMKHELSRMKQALDEQGQLLKELAFNHRQEHFVLKPTLDSIDCQQRCNNANGTDDGGLGSILGSGLSQASPQSLDHFVLELEQRFAVFFHGLVQEELAWSRWTAPHTEQKPEEIDDGVPVERCVKDMRCSSDHGSPQREQQKPCNQTVRFNAIAPLEPSTSPSSVGGFKL